MTKQTRAGFLLCNPVLSKSAERAPPLAHRWQSQGPGAADCPAGQSPNPGGAAFARRSRERTALPGWCPNPQVSFHYLSPKSPKQVEGATHEARNDLSQSFSRQVPN